MARGSPHPQGGEDRTLTDGIALGGLIADQAFDSNALLANLDECDAALVTSQHLRRSGARRIDHDLYAWRHLIENVFCKRKESKRVALRTCKPTAASKP